MAYDGMGAGSNEFFSGSIEYFNFLQAHPPSIVTTITNMNIENDPINNCKKQNAVNCVKPYDVIVKGGRKIGLLGFVPTDLFSIASPGPLLALYDYKAAAALAITALQTDHPDCKIIIALSQVSRKDCTRHTLSIHLAICPHIQLAILLFTLCVPLRTSFVPRNSFVHTVCVSPAARRGEPAARRHRCWH